MRAFLAELAITFVGMLLGFMVGFCVAHDKGSDE